MKMTAMLAFLSLLMTGAFNVSAQETTAKPMTHKHTMKGYLVDKMCATGMAKKAPDEAMAKAAKHTKSCALEESCMESGFGLMSDGKWYKFDDAGDKKALAWLNKTDKKNELMVEVTGTHDGDIFKVVSLKEAKSIDTKKKMEPKKDDMNMEDMKKD
jgi:hypothetical protein